jgi:NAD-dependent DNA ligase/DNA polymerase/3'-5' exonuclease PolX
MSSRTKIVIDDTPLTPKNATYVDILDQLATIMAKRGDNIRARVYKKAQETILAMTDDIYSPQQLKGQAGIGSTILEKLDTFDKTGTLPIIEQERGKPENILSDVYGIGPKKAVELVKLGITSIAQLRERQDEVLNKVQKAGLKYYEDIMERIPRSEIDEYVGVFQKTFDSVSESGDRYEIVGSYRRGAAASGDIDVILTSTRPAFFDNWIDALLATGVIVEVLSRGKTKCLVITKMGKARRVDFLYTSPEEYPFAVLYFTGSKGFNAAMRGHSLKMGWSLNEHGFSKVVDKKKEEKVLLNIVDEQGIFDVLKLEYKEPSERIDGRSVVSLVDMPKLEKVYRSRKTLKNKKGEKGVFAEEVLTIPKEPTIEKEDFDFIEPLIETVPEQLVVEPTVEQLIEPVVETVVEPVVETVVEPVVETVVEPVVEEVPKEPETKKKREPKTEDNITKLLSRNMISQECGDSVKNGLLKLKNENLKPKKPKGEKKPRIKIGKTLKVESAIPKSSPKESDKKESDKKESDKKKSPKVSDKKVSPKISDKIPPKTKKIRKPTATGKNKTQKNIEIVQEMNTKMTPVETEHAKTHIKSFQENGISVLDQLTLNDLTAILVLSNDTYYNKKTPLMSDNEYDIVKEYVDRKYPANTITEQIGAPVQKNKVELPYNMPSMDKIKPDTSILTSWSAKYKGPYVISRKLDGVSGMYISEPEPKLYTRGDGKVGQDISHLIKHLKLPKATGLVARGEFIIPREVFKTKYADKFANARNMVSGMINSKTVDDSIRDLHFVTYEVISPQLDPSKQLAALEKSAHEVVKHEVVETVSNDMLSEILLDWRANSEYEIDGIIVTDDHVHPRVEGNPDHAFAFKMVLSDQMAEAKVVDVEWSPSKDGYLKPRVRIEPIALGGVTIEYATGFNGKFIKDNKIGIGALIKLIRSGDVIPHIMSVSMPADEAKMPKEEYSWTESGVDIVLTNVGDNAIVREKNITMFFKTLEVDGLGEGNVKKLIKTGYNSVAKIIAMSKADFETVEGFKEKTAEKLSTGIKEKVAKASLIEIMVASNTLGRGVSTKNLELIMEAYPQIFQSGESMEEKVKMLVSIKGVGEKNAKAFVQNMGTFLEFLRECRLEGKLNASVVPKNVSVPVENVDITNPLYGKTIVMTKVRDKSIIDHLAKVGAKLGDAMKKDTFVLIVKSHEDKSNKTEYAMKNGIPIMTPEEFVKKYM